MKNTFRKPYIYKVTNLETGQYYIGSQYSGKKIGENYFTSSTNKNFRDDFKNYREEKYKIEIVKEFEDPEECGHAENYMIFDHMLLKDGLCLNKFCCCNGKKIFSKLGTHPSEETRKRMSLSHKGIPQSEEAKKKISLSHKIKISIEGMVFDSYKEASKYYNVHLTTISYWLKTKKHNAVYVEK